MLIVDTHDVLVRYVKFRSLNEIAGSETTGGSGSNIKIWPNWPYGFQHNEPLYNIVFDHNSITWGYDESGPLGNVKDITFSWNILAAGLSEYTQCNTNGWDSGTDPRMCGQTFGVGPMTYNFTMHHNLFAHNNERSPIQSSGNTFEFANNLIYNWGTHATYIEPNTWREEWSKLSSTGNYLNNYYKPGPQSNSDEITITSDLNSSSRFYVAGNIGPTSGSNGWKITSSNKCIGKPDCNDANEIYRAQSLIKDVTNIKLSSAQQAYTDILNGVGARLPSLDKIDASIVNDVESGGGRIPLYKPVMPNYVSAHRASNYDSDHDGMADAWETANGFNKNDASDRNGL